MKKKKHWIEAKRKEIDDERKTWVKEIKHSKKQKKTFILRGKKKEKNVFQMK